MPVRKFSPITPGTRHKVANTFDAVTSGNNPVKALVKGKSYSGGRNHTGKMTVRNLGGGHKRKYRVIDFKRDKENIPATVKTVEYDPNRSAFIALLFYADGEKRYIIAPDKIKVGDTVMSGEKAEPLVGHAMFLDKIPLGSVIHAIEMDPGRGAVIARSAGTSATLVGIDGKYAIIKLPSGEVRKILKVCKATIGSTSNGDHQQTVSGKAGRTRWLGKRPRVRGVAMNPVDHPMGGGEGKASGGHPRSRTGVMAKGQKTRNVKKHSSALIITKRKKKNKK
jgi:large subunit ribosomal protein L2